MLLLLSAEDVADDDEVDKYESRCLPLLTLFKLLTILDELEEMLPCPLMLPLLRPPPLLLLVLYGGKEVAPTELGMLLLPPPLPPPPFNRLDRDEEPPEDEDDEDVFDFTRRQASV